MSKIPSTIPAAKSADKNHSSASSQRGAQPFFGPVQAKLNVNKPGDSFEQEADRIAGEVMGKGDESRPAPFFNATPPSIQKAPVIIQRDENDKAPAATDPGSKVFTEGASLAYEQLKLQPGFAEWKEQQTTQLKYKLWDSQPADLRFGMIAFGLTSLGILGATLASDPGFRSKTVTALDDVPLPLFLLPGSEYLALSSFKYKLPAAENAPYTFKTEFDFDFFTKLAHDKWGGPKVGLTVEANSEYSGQGGFKPLTGGKIGLTLGGGIVNLQGFYNEHLPPTPMLISDPTRGESPAWLMRSLPSQLEQNLPLGTGVYLTVDVSRLPELWGGGEKKQPPPRREGVDELSRKENAGGDAVSGKAAPAIVGDVLSSGNGSSLDRGTRSFMEDRIGYDFSQVRVHTGPQAAESAQAINARAYTSGHDIVFDHNQYTPGSDKGRELLAHELVHVVQQDINIRRKENPVAETTAPTKLKNVDDPVKDVAATKQIREKLELGNYSGAFLDLSDHLEWGGLGAKKAWLKNHNDVRLAFLKHLPASVIADVYSAAELQLKPAFEAFDEIDCWYPSEQEKQVLYTQNLPLFDHILGYLSPYTGDAMIDVIGELTTDINKKTYTSSFGNREFHVINLLAPGIQRKFDFYKKYPDFFKLVSKKFDPYTGIRHETMKNLTDTNDVDREKALFIYDQLRVLDEEQRRAFIETGIFASGLEADKDAEAFYKKKYGAQYAVLPHNWDAAIWPWTWSTWDAPFAERLTIDHVALMSSALSYEDKSTRSFGFDRGIDLAVDKTKDKTISDATKLIQSLNDDANFLEPQRLFLLLAIGIRAGMQEEIIAKVLLPKNTDKKITGAILRVVENSGFVAAENFKYHFDTAIQVDHDKSLGWYAAKQTLFGGKEGSVFGERRGTFDLRTLQNTDTLKGSVGGLKFGFETHEGDQYYNNEWLDKQIKENTGSESLKPNIDEYKGSQRQGKIYASISPSIKQANIYASVLPVEGLNYFGAGTLYRSGQGVLQGVSLRLSWTKDPSDPENQIKLLIGIENFQISDFQMVSPKSTLAIGEIGLKGLRLDLDNDMMAKGYTFLGLFKDADLTVKTLMNFLPNVLKLIPYAVMVMTEEFKGVKAHQYKDAFGALMQTTFGSLRSSLSFSSVQVKNMYDTSAGFLDDFSIQDHNKKGEPVRHSLDVRESFLWTVDASRNIKDRIRSIDKKIRTIKAKVVGFDAEKDIDPALKIEDLEKRKKELTNIVADKALKYENRDKEMDELRQIYKDLPAAIAALDKAYNKEKAEHNPFINEPEMELLEREKAELEKDLAYLDNEYYDDKKLAEGDEGGIKRYEAREKKSKFEAKYRTYDVAISLQSIQLKGGNYVKDLINDTLQSLGFESPKLEGIENIDIESVNAAYVASGKGASALGKKQGIGINKIYLPKITAPFLHFKTDGMRIEANKPELETVFVSVSVDFAANPLDKDPDSLYKYKVSSVTIEKANFDGLKVFMGKNQELPLLDFPVGVPVTAMGIELYDYDPEKRNINLRIRDVKAAGTYQDKNETDKTSKEVKFGIDTTLDNETEAGRKNAIDLKYNKDQSTVETKLNIASAWIDMLNIQSPTMSISSIPGVKAIEVKDVQADVKVWLAKRYEGLDIKRDLTIDVNSLHIGEISAQGIKMLMTEDADTATSDPTKKKTARKVQEITLPKEDRISISDINVAGLRLTMEDSGMKLGTTGTADASVKLGKTDLGGIGYAEKTAKGSVLKAIAIHSAKFEKLTLEALGRNGRQYSLKEFFKFFGRTRLEGIEASGSFTDGVNSGSIGVMGQKKETPEGLKNLPISIDYHEEAEGKPGYYSLRLPLSRINLPALNIVTGNHTIIIPKPSDKYSLSYLSDVDVKLRAYVNIPEDGKVSYDIYLDSLDIGRMIVYGLEYHNSVEGVDVVFDKVAPISIPDVKAGGFRFSSTRGFDVFGKAGGWVDAAVGPDKDIEASFGSIRARLENGEFLAESDKGRSALDINVASLGYRQDKDGNMSITLQNISGGFPKMKISKVDPVTKIKTVTDISSIDKALYAEKVVIKLNADNSREIEADRLSAGGLKIVNTETAGANVSTTTVNLDPGAVNADTTSVKLNADKSREISVKGIHGGSIKANMLSTGPGGKSEKIISLPDPDLIKVDELKIVTDTDKHTTVTLVRPLVKKFRLEIPSQEKSGDYFAVTCDMQVHGDITLADGNYKSMAIFSKMAPGASVDAFILEIPDYMPVEITNLRIENKDSTTSTPSGPSAPKPLTAAQQKLLDLEKARDDAKETLDDTPSSFDSPNGDSVDNPAWQLAVDAWRAAQQSYEDQKATMIAGAKAEAAGSMTKKYLDAVKGHVYASLEVYGTKLPLTVETYKGDKYVEFSDEFIKGLKPVISSIIGSTTNAPFWNSPEMKKAGAALQRWYTYGVPYTRGLINAIAAGNGAGAALVFMDKTTFSTGILSDDPKMYGLKFDFDTSLALDIFGADEFEVPLCEAKYKHPEKDNFYNLYGLVEYYGFVSPALVSTSGQRDAANVANLTKATQGSLDDKGLKEAIAQLVAYIKTGFVQESDNIVAALKKNITKVEVAADLTFTPQEVITELMRKSKSGKLEFKDPKKQSIEGVHVEGNYTNDGSPKATGSIGGGPAGTGNITIPGAMYTSQADTTKVVYDSISIKPITVDYKNDTLTLSNDSVMLRGLKAAFKK